MLGPIGSHKSKACPCCGITASQPKTPLIFAFKTAGAPDPCVAMHNCSGMRRSDLEKHLRKQGCSMLRKGRRHTIYFNPTNEKESAVPRHNEFRPIIVWKICDELEVERPKGR